MVNSFTFSVFNNNIIIGIIGETMKKSIAQDFEILKNIW